MQKAFAQNKYTNAPGNLAARAGFAVISLAIVVFEWYQLAGKQYGMFYGVFADPHDPRFAGIQFSGGWNHYQEINIWYFTIGICLLVYLVGILFGRSLPAVIVRILALSISTFPFMNMLMYKFEVRDVSSRYEWLETSIYLDCACIALMGTIAGIEIISYISRPTDNIQLPGVVLDGKR